MTASKKPTKQGVSSRSGTAPPKDKQFGQPGGNPRHNGAWKKEDTPRYKLEEMMKLTEDELLQIQDDTTQPKFDRALAKAVQSEDWNTIERIINQVYGQPKESVEHSNPDGNLAPTVRIIDERQDKNASGGISGKAKD